MENKRLIIVNILNMVFGFVVFILFLFSLEFLIEFAFVKLLQKPGDFPGPMDLFTFISITIPFREIFCVLLGITIGILGIIKILSKGMTQKRG